MAEQPDETVAASSGSAEAVAGRAGDCETRRRPRPRPVPARPEVRTSNPPRSSPAYGSVEAADAIAAAVRCEQEQAWLDSDSESDGSGREDDSNRTIAWDAYLDRLIALDTAYPTLACCTYFETGLCTHGRPCACGGIRSPWPWSVHGDPVRPFCMCWTLSERQAWQNAAHTLHPDAFDCT